MKTHSSRATAILCLAVASCSTHSSDGPAATTKVGTLGLDLTSVSASGKVYRLRQAELPVRAETSSTPTTILDSEQNPNNPVLETFLAPNDYVVDLLDGWFLEQDDSLLGTSAPVQAKLVNGSEQLFSIQSNQETFVQFQFQVNGERVTFGPPGRLIIGVGIHERDGGTAPATLDPRRVLIETNPKVLSNFTLEGVLQAAQQNAGLSPDPVGFYQQIIDTYASAGNAAIKGSAHCGDETTGGAPSLNGFPLRCDRLEHQQIGNIGLWFPIAAVNRLDLAPEDGSHCGQQRMIFANNAPIGNGRMFMIIETQIPNPSPECGVAACKPVADFWAAQNTISDAATRGSRLTEAFETGSPELSVAGFKPFLNVDNLGVGNGTIRTNNFDDDEWTLREFKAAADGLGQTRVVQFPVDQAPNGDLWDDTTALPQGSACRSSFIQALGGLLSDDPAEMAFVVDEACLDAESPNDFTRQNYPSHLANGSGTFRSAIATAIAGTGLAPENIAARAQFAGSCMGCHEEAIGNDLGHGITAPSSNGFVQVDESSFEDCGDGSQCFVASPALKQVFLPRRLTALNALLAAGSAGCGAEGGVDAGPPPRVGDGGVPVIVVPPATDAGAAPFAASHASRAALAPSDTVDALMAREQAARRSLHGRTLGGQPASATH